VLGTTRFGSSCLGEILINLNGIDLAKVLSRPKGSPSKIGARFDKVFNWLELMKFQNQRLEYREIDYTHEIWRVGDTDRLIGLLLRMYFQIRNNKKPKDLILGPEPAG
jgi:hypothetical protein